MSVSIIIPTYNAAITIAACLESIVNQKFKHYEVLIMDGKSTDNTLQICESFSLALPSMTTHSQADRGIYDAMNTGIHLAKFEWIYFLGSDDTLYSSSTLEDVFKDENLNHCDVIYGNVLSDRFGGKYDGPYDYKKLRKKNICHQAIFFKKAVFDKTGNFNLKYPSLSDYHHNIKWFLNNSIRKCYRDIVIANYADGGFSSLNIDERFSKDKNLAFIRYGWRSLPIYYLLHLIKFELKSRFT